MNGKTTTAGIVICVLALFAMMEYGHAAPEPVNRPLRIGTVSVNGVLKRSKKYMQYKIQIEARLTRIHAQLEQLLKEVEKEEGDLKTLRPGTADYRQQLDTVLAKRFEVQRQEYLKQHEALESKKWLEDIYQQTLKAVNEIAREKALDLVLEKTDPEFPVTSEALFSALATHKVLFSAGCVDLTDEVIARVDAGEAPKP